MFDFVRKIYESQKLTCVFFKFLNFKRLSLLVGFFWNFLGNLISSSSLNRLTLSFSVYLSISRSWTFCKTHPKSENAVQSCRNCRFERESEKTPVFLLMYVKNEKFSQFCCKWIFSVIDFIVEKLKYKYTHS